MTTHDRRALFLQVKERVLALKARHAPENELDELLRVVEQLNAKYEDEQDLMVLEGRASKTADLDELRQR